MNALGTPSTPARGSTMSARILVRLGEVMNRTFVLPIVIFFPTSRCNSRCVSCDWWKSSGATDLSLKEIDSLAGALAGLDTQLVVFSGGEPLLRPDVFDVARTFRARGMALHLLTSGLLIERSAAEIARDFSRVIVSLDATSGVLYQAVRGVAALATVERGVARLRRLAPDLPITARSTLHRMNFRELPRLVEHASAMGFNGISFLPADVSSSAFGRDHSAVLAGLALSTEEVAEFEALIEDTIARHRSAFESGFIAESPAKLRRLARYYRALAGDGAFPPVACNAPYSSVVVEADGMVRPCFFHNPVGNIRTTPIEIIVQRNLPTFRRTLDVGSNPVCARCVCSMKTGLRHAPWH
jgi:MoaA/NifB/PqqE/SkfB family radical SAM enzyme